MFWLYLLYYYDAKGYEKEEYAVPPARENDSPAERSFQVGVQKVALEPECPTESLSRHSRLPTLQGVLMQILQ